MIRIPTNGVFSQPNKGDIFGNISRSLGVDFKTSPGKLKSSPRLTAAVKDNDSGISNMGLPQAFALYITNASKYFALCGIGEGIGGGNAGTGKLIVSDDGLATSDWDVDGLSNSPTDIHAGFSDMVPYNNVLLVSRYTGTANKISALTGTSWDTDWFGTTMTGTFNEPNASIKNFIPAFNGNLYITDGDTLIYAPDVSSTAVTSGPGVVDTGGKYRIIWGRSTSNTIWVCLMTYDRGIGTKSYMARWNGVGTAFDAIYDMNCPCVMSGCVIDDVMHVVDSYGVVKQFTGAGFSEIARLPVANLNIEMFGVYNDLSNNRWISHRSMENVDGKINIAVNSTTYTGGFVEEMPSGVWEYDPKNPTLGLYHKGAPCSLSTDWGQQYLLGAGAVFNTRRTTYSLLAGFAYYTDNASTSRNAVFYDDIATNTNKRSSFVTSFVNSPNIEENFKKAGYRFTPLQSNEKIIGKWRKAKKTHLPFMASVTWTSTTTFTSTDANFQYASLGDEVEIVMGVGASATAHITVLPAPSVGTYTVTIDTAIGGASGTGKVKVNNFKKFITGTTLSVSEEFGGLPDSVGTRIQIKTEIQAQGDFELDDLTIINSKNR